MLFLLLILFTTPLALAIAALYFFYSKKFKVWGNLGIPHTNPSFPFGDIGGVSYKADFGHCVSEIYKKFPHEPFVGCWILFRPHILVRDPELVKDILVRNFMSFHDRGINVNEKVDPLSAHLFSIGGSKWRNLRVKLTPTFTSGKMKNMFSIFVECADLFKNVMENHAAKDAVVDMKELSACFTTDVISLCAFGVKANSMKNPDAEFRRYGRKFLEPTISNNTRALIQFLTPDLHRILQLKTTNEESSNFFMKTFKESLDYREKNKIKRNDFLDLLIQLLRKGKLDVVDDEEELEKLKTISNEENVKFTYEQAAAQAFVFFVAGFETSSTTMQFALYELAKNVDIQKKARQEINEVLEKHGGELTYDAVFEMDYLTRIINETLRKYPPVPFLQRENNKEYQIPGTNKTIPKGTTFIVDVLGMQNDEKHFPNPEKFDPDRFTEEEKNKRHHYTYLPFGEGPRNCIGMRFGLLQTKVGLLTLLKNFEFHVAKETKIPLIYDEKTFILSPKGGMYLKITRVKN